MKDIELWDVSLAYEDDGTNKTHKVMLFSASPFFLIIEKTQCCVQLTFIIELIDASLKYLGLCPLIPKMWVEHGSDRISNAPEITYNVTSRSPEVSPTAPLIHPYSCGHSFSGSPDACGVNIQLRHDAIIGRGYLVLSWSASPLPCSFFFLFQHQIPAVLSCLTG